MIGTFTDYALGNALGVPGTTDTFDREIKKFILYFLGLAVYAFIVAYLQMALWMVTGERQCKRIRELYYHALLEQEIGWYDAQNSGELTSRLSGDINLMVDGMSDKVGLIFQAFAQFIAGFIIAFIRGWRLALVLLAILPLLIGAGAFMSASIASRSSKGQSAYARAGHLAEEVLAGIKTVAAFGGEKKEIERYENELDKALEEGKRRSIISGVGIGAIVFIIFGAYGLAFWAGSRWAADGLMTGAQVLNVVFAMIIGAMGIGITAPSFTALATAQGAATKIFKVIKRESKINPFVQNGAAVQSSISTVEFKGVDFAYPSRQEVPVLNNFNLTINAGQTVALVGESGSGKSTCIQLLERFYDPTQGQVLVDGVDVRQLNLRSLRSVIGLVGQEPILFGASIYQNVAWGASTFDSEEKGLASRAKVEEACKMANAHDFISKLPQGYDTLVGEKGALLSGGQKQRIAIARALVKNPQILLLDEATSALDTESERVVQTALDNASKNRTTLVIAHRLSTIKNADRIVVLRKGVIVETGTHDQLIKQDGLYAKLVRAQTLKQTSDHISTGQDDSIMELVEDKPLEEEEGAELDVVTEKQVYKAQTKNTVRSITTAEKSAAIEEEELNKKTEQYKDRSLPWGRIARLNSPEKGVAFLGFLGSIVDGAVMPVFSVVFAQILAVFGESDPNKLRRDADFWSLMFLVLAIVSFFSAGLRVGVFAWCGEALTRRLRSMSFEAMVRQEMGFFDLPENGTGILGAKLATEAEDIKGLSSIIVGNTLQAISSLAVGLTIAFVNGWLLALVVIACIPLLGFAGQAHMRVLSGFSSKAKRAYEEAAQLACESVENIRTVAAISREQTFIELYKDKLAFPHHEAIKGAFLSSVGYGSSQALIFLVYSLAFFVGSRLILNGTYQVDQMFRVLFAVVFAIVGVSQVLSLTPSFTKARIAAFSLFDLIDRPSQIDPFATEAGAHPDIEGRVLAETVDFAYPARPEVQVLQSMDLQVLPGQKVAIVGPSGSGKSTIVALVQRFYDVASGRVSVEDADVRDWNLKSLRQQMSLVGQEPVLFDRTIAENIAYGCPEASTELIQEAARMSNIHDFISKLPQGYDTPVGEHGSQLSGGQKQRIAIARAIVRNPRLLLLDEATSALDSESEKVVQHALDRASKGRTTITIAHRLSTIQDADLILVFKGGRVVEQGRHMDLLRKPNGVYKNLVQKQSLSTSS